VITFDAVHVTLWRNYRRFFSNTAAVTAVFCGTRYYDILFCCSAEDFALSIHGGQTSVDPVLATVWGNNVAQSSVEDRCSYSNGTVPTTTRDTVSTQDGADISHDTVLVGLRGFYVRLRGNLRTDDLVVFDCWTEQSLESFTSAYTTS